MDYEIENLGKHTFISKDPAFLLYQRYIAPFIYGPHHPYEVGNKMLNNGTAFFVQGNETFAVTCAHCVNCFFKRQRKHNNIFLKIGEGIFWDLESRIIDKDDRLDLCTFKFSEDDLKRVGGEKNFLTIIASHRLQEGSTVCVIGYPGQILKPVAKAQLETGVLGIFEIIREGNISDSSFYVEFQKDDWVLAKNESNIDLNEFDNVGGMSGCPIIFQGDLSPTLAGIVFESFSYEENGKKYLSGVRARFKCFDKNGKLIKEEV